MAKGGADGLDATALRAEVERAIGALEDVRRISQQLTHAANGVEAVREILDGMERRVKAHLAQIDVLVAGDDDEPGSRGCRQAPALSAVGCHAVTPTTCPVTASQHLRRCDPESVGTMA